MDSFDRDLFESSIWYIEPLHLKAIEPHLKLFKTVRKEYSTGSRIHQEGGFAKFYLKYRYDYIYMAKDCIESKKLLRDCHINPPPRPDMSVTGAPFWFKVQKYDNDGNKMTPESITMEFWKEFKKRKISINILNMSFDEISKEINDELSQDPKIAIGDVIISARRIFKGKNDGFFGMKCILDFKYGKYNY